MADAKATHSKSAVITAATLERLPRSMPWIGGGHRGTASRARYRGHGPGGLCPVSAQRPPRGIHQPARLPPRRVGPIALLESLRDEQQNPVVYDSELADVIRHEVEDASVTEQMGEQEQTLLDARRTPGESPHRHHAGRRQRHERKSCRPQAASPGLRSRRTSCERAQP